MTTAPARRSEHARPAPGFDVPRSQAVDARSQQAASSALLGLQGVPRDVLVRLLSRAAEFDTLGDNAPKSLAGRSVAALFFEDSTRTKTSFAIAAHRLGANVVDLSASSSSVNKGETLVDTARTVEAMGVRAMIVRAKQSGAAALVQQAVRVPVINAGDGRHEHPTQGLIDALTIARAHHRPDFDLSGLTVAIVGDVANSRVARSNIAALATLGATTICVGPPSMVPATLASLGTHVANDLDKVVPIADAVMMLRIQFERHGEASSPVTGSPPPTRTIASIREYRDGFALTRERAQHLKPGAIVMHPGPMNRGIELDADVADGPASVVLKQVANGVLVRMAALEMAAASH